MIKSVVSKYRDIVAIYPVDKLTAAKQNDCYVDVMSLLRSTGTNIVGISVDNAATNRKFYTDYLYSGKLSSCIFYSVTGQPIFLIFDPVHAIKNVYNNFQSRKVFECPPMERNLPEGCHADFKHVTELYNRGDYVTKESASTDPRDAAAEEYRKDFGEVGCISVLRINTRCSAFLC